MNVVGQASVPVILVDAYIRHNYLIGGTGAVKGTADEVILPAGRVGSS